MLLTSKFLAVTVGAVPSTSIRCAEAAHLQPTSIPDSCFLTGTDDGSSAALCALSLALFLAVPICDDELPGGDVHTASPSSLPVVLGWPRPHLPLVPFPVRGTALRKKGGLCGVAHMEPI